MKRECPSCRTSIKLSSKNGSFIRKSDGRRMQRYICKVCERSFSQATFQSCYRQKKRRLNPRVKELLASGVSQRRIAMLLKIHKTTVKRKLIFLGKEARKKNRRDFEKLGVVFEMQFDDLETIEHTKMKPVSVTMAVEAHTRRILGFRVSRMPAKGLLAKRARKKYGPRPDERTKNREELFKEIRSKIHTHALIVSDQSWHYPEDVKRFFPEAIHHRVKGKRGCVVGQGELKKTGFDPIFSLNHSFAMFRYCVNRLIRKTWCTTKCLDRLRDHLDIYIEFHNRRLI